MKDKIFKIVVLGGIGIVFVTQQIGIKIRRQNVKELEEILTITGQNVIDNRLLIREMEKLMNNHSKAIMGLNRRLHIQEKINESQKKKKKV